MTYSSSEGLYYGGSTQHRGWVLAQFSKWVRPGYVRVEATYNPQNGVYVVAFKGTQYVVVAMNNSSSAQSVTFSISNASFSSVDKFTSSQTKNGASEGAVTVANNSFTSSLDAQSVNTFVGGTVNVLPIKGEDKWYSVETPYRAATPANAATRFMYLINGKRCRVPGMNEASNLAPGMYVIPEKASQSRSAGKPVRNAGQ
jgi:hypothetical protein